MSPVYNSDTASRASHLKVRFWDFISRICGSLRENGRPRKVSFRLLALDAWINQKLGKMGVFLRTFRLKPLFSAHIKLSF